MTNREIAAILFNISALLKRHEGNPYRIRAYRRAARNILRAQHSIAERAQAGQPLGVPLLGKRLTKTITQLATTGQCDVYEDIIADLPSAQQALLRVPGIGPTLALRLTHDLNAVDTDDFLQHAARIGLQQTWGIGPKRAQAIIDHLAATPASFHQQVERDGNVIYVQEHLWHEGHKQAA